MLLYVYPKCVEDMASGAVDLETGGDTLKAALFSAYTYTAADTTYGSMTSATEVANGSGYTTGGVTLAAANLNVSTTGSVTTVDYDDTTSPMEWTSATFSTVGAAIYDTTNSNSLVAWIDFEGTESCSDGTFTVNVNASGLFTMTAN